MDIWLHRATRAFLKELKVQLKSYKTVLKFRVKIAAAHRRQRHDVVDALGFAETLHRERQVGGDH